MIPDSAFSVLPKPKSFGTIRPIGASALQGIAFWGETLVAIDATNGYLLQIDPLNENTKILNSSRELDFVDASGLAIAGDTLWLTWQKTVYFCQLNGDLSLQPFVTLPYTADGVAVKESTIYITCQKVGYILIYSRDTGREITRLYAPGIGVENIAVRDEELWVSDREEQTIYCLDRATGNIQFSLLTPFENPTGLAFYRDKQTNQDTLYVAYASEEPYIRDNPNAQPNYELQFRDRTFIHPLYFRADPENRYTLSTGYLIEMSYVEELSPLEEVEFKDVEWRIALPSETDRQKVRKIESVGLPFTEEIQGDQRVAVFKFDTLKPGERHLFGWKALLEVWSIKYRLTPRDVEKLTELPPEFQEQYLVDDDELAMETDIIRRAAREAIGTETNLLRKMYSIRNYVYDKLSYGIKPHIDTPNVVLERGIGSCGEYLGVLLALTRLNGIATRTVGRYKCPPHPDKLGVPLEPDFNHVWLEFYVPGVGWLPMESNPDDTVEGGPYPTRFFMGLAWYHVEIGKGISFETLKSQGSLVKKENISIGELAINHVRFKILEELSPEG
ncbi:MULTISPECIES: transglutaminase-like domain-containing protein [unclassified Coleofasciculus]|uniref:transglutaminase-like domain-containing protein n=1 Tax=unclassified Coleofasciculus TaxID=2692782 RepID=UPI00187F28E9|nr:MULTISPECIES: transglutaminase family protein [unclassified Coleofasciculus]MBE9128236.1 transglutaminase family protein [Coleofasciculus sp. LEGE 07081]MBE9147769.1 transglutaminase family protein [Coleofasciculus sp. LEGE 07092]